jgi:hypothetical protein
MKRLAWWVPSLGQHQIRYVGGVGSGVELVFASETSSMLGYNSRPMAI